MAKPIILIRVGSECKDNLIPIHKGIKEQTNNEYHVLIIIEHDRKEATIECFNDCKGLSDIDIEKLIESIKRE